MEEEDGLPKPMSTDGRPERTASKLVSAYLLGVTDRPTAAAAAEEEEAE